MASTSAHLDTPIRLPDGRSEQITVTDPAHPLYGRCFSLASATATVGSGGQVLVVYRDGISLRIPARATSLHPVPPCLLVSKLSIDGIRGLLRLAQESGKVGGGTSAHHHRDDFSEHESEADFAKSHGSLRGEP